MPHRLWGKRRGGGRGCGRRSRSARFAAGALGSAQLFGRGVLPRLFFSNSRPQNRGAARGLLPPRKGASGRTLFLPHRLWEKRRGGAGGSAALSLRSVRRRGACLCPTIRARGFAALVFLTAARKPGRGAGAFAAAQGCKRVRCFCRTACGENSCAPPQKNSA